MVRILSLTAQGVLLAFLLYELVIACWGWARPQRTVPGRRDRRFRVLIAAHDEAAVIGGVLSDLAAQEHRHVRVVVIADRCRDDTAAVASRLATVVERTSGPEGKGAALDWHLAAEPLDADEALVVLDADTRVPPELLSRFNDELDAGEHVLQAYLGVSNPDASVLTTASALTYWAGNRMVQLARSRLGWSADLGGTGMCFSPQAAATLGGFGSGLTEDQDAMARLVAAGFRVRWLHDLVIRDEKPVAVAGAIRQRARWTTGKRRVARSRLPSLLAAARSQASWAPIDVALRLINPGRSFLMLLALLLAVGAAVSRSDLLFPPWLWIAVAIAVVVSPLAFLMRDDVPLRYLIRYPLAIGVPLIWLPVRLLSRVAGGRWNRTPRQAENS